LSTCLTKKRSLIYSSLSTDSKLRHFANLYVCIAPGTSTKDLHCRNGFEQCRYCVWSRFERETRYCHRVFFPISDMGVESRCRRLYLLYAALLCIFRSTTTTRQFSGSSISEHLMDVRLSYSGFLYRRRFHLLCSWNYLVW
jgi:hypothetical protein